MSDASREPAPKLTLEVRDLHKSFGGQAALRGVDLVVPEGTTCVLMGVSGSGKTVLMKHIMGLMRPDRGVVRVEGEEVAKLDEPSLNQMRRKLGILFQANALFDSLNVYDNVAFPLRERTKMPEPEITKTVNETLAKVGLSHAATRFPGSSPAACRSAWASRAPPSSSRRSSSTTTPRRAWIRSPRRR